MMEPAALLFPHFDPVAFQIAGLSVRWYGLAYLAGFLLGSFICARLARQFPALGVRPQDVDDFLMWAVLGVLLGGRLGYVLFYQLSFYLAQPEEILQLWRGGMSFHGGLLGFVVAGIGFCHVRKIPILPFADILAAVAPIGLFFGRIANFINGELYGRVSTVPWAMVFPQGGLLPRHPSQLYHALGEGLLLALVLLWLARQERVRQRPGLLLGIFLVGYAILRALVECFREPDAQIGFLFGGTTMGQILSLPMLLVGIYFVSRAWCFKKR